MIAFFSMKGENMKLNRYALCLFLGLGLFGCKKKEEPNQAPSSAGTSSGTTISQDKGPDTAPSTASVSTEEPDAMIMINFESLYKRFQGPLKALINTQMANQPMGDMEGKFASFFKDKIFAFADKFKSLKLQGKIYNKEVEFSINMQFQPSEVKWTNTDQMLGQFLPADDIIRMQMSSLTGFGLESIINQIIQMIPAEKQAEFQKYQPLIQKAMTVSEGMQMAASLTANPTMNNPRILEIASIKDANQMSEYFDEVTRVSEAKVTKGTIKLGKENKEYRHYTLPPNPNTGKALGEIVLFNNYVLIEMNGEQQDIQNLALAIESGKGQPLKAMNTHGKSGGFYLDVNYKKLIEIQGASSDATMLAPLLKELSTEDGIITGYINGTIQDSWLKVRVPTPAFTLAYAGYQFSRASFHQQKQEELPGKPPEMPFSPPASEDSGTPAGTPSEAPAPSEKSEVAPEGKPAVTETKPAQE